MSLEGATPNIKIAIRFHEESIRGFFNKYKRNGGDNSEYYQGTRTVTFFD